MKRKIPMFPIRRSRQFLESCCTLMQSRTFRTSLLSAARPAGSPRVMQKGRTASGPTPRTNQVKKPVEAGDALPPLSLLQMAYKSGALDVTPESALEVLRDYQERERTRSLGWERKLCNDQGITIGQFTLLGTILNRSSVTATRQLSKRLMLSASALGGGSATLHLVEGALRHSALHSLEMVAPLQRLTLLATQSQEPEAMFVYGQVLQAQDSDIEALKWFRKAAESGAHFGRLGEALTHEGQLLLKLKDNVEAEKVLRRAALELDDPAAYFILAKLQPSQSADRETYLLKAAMSGIAEAAYDLGVIETQKYMDNPRHSLDVERLKSTSVRAQIPSKNFKKSVAWFEVAAAGGFGYGMLNLAKIYKSSGQDEKGRAWLDRAECLPELRRESRNIRDNWENF